MHFTIDKNFNHPDSSLHGKAAHWIPGHDLGEGWTRYIVQLAKGDTADNPSSTKRPLYGPAFVVYDVAHTGITTHVHKDAGEFYDALYEAEHQRRSLNGDHNAEAIRQNTLREVMTVLRTWDAEHGHGRPDPAEYVARMLRYTGPVPS
jgi:hypothetical protein